MSNGYVVDASCLRYVVPFKYKGTFEEVYAKVENETEKKKEKTLKKWNRIIETLEGPESDLYLYIKNEFRFETMDQPLSEKKAGCSWIYYQSKEAGETSNGRIKELIYYPDAIPKGATVIPDGKNLHIINAGIMIFRNGMGFFWYEFAFQEDELTSDELKKFQNSIRELNRRECSFLWEKSSDENATGFIAKKAEIKTIQNKKGETSTINIPQIVHCPFLLGKWIVDLLSFLKTDEISFFAPRKCAWSSCIEESMKAVKEIGVNNEAFREDFSKYVSIPDKPLLLSYVAFKENSKEASREVRYELAYHLTNGYKDSYRFSNLLIQEMKQPFEDVIWYATQEGVAYLAWESEENKAVFKSTISSKFKVDYFTLYMKVLYQSFSLLMFAERIKTEVYAVNEKNMSSSSDNAILKLYEEINLFLTKSMDTSVSHIHHQSEFFTYLEKSLRIHEDVQSVYAGLTSMEALQKEARQRAENERIEKEEEREQTRTKRLEAIMGFLALFGISSAFMDTFALIEKFTSQGNWVQLSLFTKIVECTAGVIIISFGVVALILTFGAAKRAFTNKKKTKERKEPVE